MPPKEIDELREVLDNLNFAREGIVPFKGLPVMERAFFPGGNGLFKGNSGRVTTRGVLIIGSNFGCNSDFLRENGTLMRLDETRTSNTWKGLYRILTLKTSIDLDECFFTNSWPFLHKGKSNETKGLTKDWPADHDLMMNCMQLFEATLNLIKPRLIVALGPPASAFLGCFWPLELAIWRDNSISAMDSRPIHMVNFNGTRIICTAVTHPSHSNSWRRRPPYGGTEGEISLLSEAAFKATQIHH
jgi:hypothetical protein